MRYYRIEITDKDGNTPLDSIGNPVGPFDTSETAGRGLQIEFDALITGYDVVNSGTLVVIHGLPITMLSQSVQLSGCRIVVYAGFSDGLPLENSSQRGVIFSGQIYNTYANWLGTHQTLNLIVNPSPLINESGQATSITLSGVKGEKLSDVLRRGLNLAFPDFDIDISISDKLVLAEDAPGVYSRLGQLAAAIRSQSFSMINNTAYTGIQIVMQYKVIRIFDNTSESGDGISILPQELVGQPTWIGPVKVSFKCPLRADLRCGDVIELPQNIISGPGSLLSVNTERFNSMQRDSVNFTGEFLITSVRHVGEYLNADGNNAWNSIFEAVALAKNST